VTSIETTRTINWLTTIGPVSYDFFDNLLTWEPNNFSNLNPLKTSIIEHMKNRRFREKSLNMRVSFFQIMKKAIGQYWWRTNWRILWNIAIIRECPASLNWQGHWQEMKRYVLPQRLPELDFLSKMSDPTYTKRRQNCSVHMSDNAFDQSLELFTEIGCPRHLTHLGKWIQRQYIKITDGTHFF